VVARALRIDVTGTGNKTTGLDDTLRRLLDHSYGPFVVVLSLARAYVNRELVARR